MTLSHGLRSLIFLSTPSGWRATVTRLTERREAEFLSTPSGWRATVVTPARLYSSLMISIHALRVEGDAMFGIISTTGTTFLSTPSGWRATQQAHRTAGCAEFLSTPSGWRATITVLEEMAEEAISIHALRVEGDTPKQYNLFKEAIFLSTPSGWRATQIELYTKDKNPISIHALRVEGDMSYTPDKTVAYISIHALRVEGDGISCKCLSRHVYFYPRPPGGGRQSTMDK